MHKIFNKRKFIFVLIITIFIFLSLEFIFFLYFHFNNLNYKLSVYSEKRKSSLSYDYFPNVDLVLPMPNINVTHYTSEFVDVFPTKDILNLGFGFFDDGINKNKKVFSVAIGDSFTRGVGSKNNLENGWVELVEKKVEWLDIINLGNLGNSLVDQKYKYDKLKKFINHDLVIYNFVFGGDLIDNITDYDGSHYISYIRNEFGFNDKEIKEKIDKINIHHGYKSHLEYFMKNKIKSYTFGFFLKFIEFLRVHQIVSDNFLPDIITGKSNVYREFTKSRMNILPDDIFKLRGIFQPTQLNINDETLIIYKEFNNVKLMDNVVKNSTNLINNFFKEINSNIKHEGTKFILIIHPSKSYVYSTIFNDKISKDKIINYSYLKKKFKDYLNEEILILDLSDKLIKEAKRNPNIDLYWKKDPHYSLEGYKVVSNIISDYLLTTNNYYK